MPNTLHCFVCILPADYGGLMCHSWMNLGEFLRTNVLWIWTS